MDVASKNLNSAKEIYLAASRLSNSAERARFLDDVCQSNAELRQRIEHMLAAEAIAITSPLDRMGAMLHPADMHTRSSAAPLVDIEDHPLIGPYQLMEKIGEGGMGVVYVARQQKPIRRTVALKLIKPGMDSKQVVARFEAERQALAMMNHSNIAKVLDAGTTESGLPYFVMELVKGTPITEYCDAHKLDLQQRLELFIKVCEAVQHAHQKGIIHRDLKPSNVLVELEDVRSVPKVIDFGVAKATQQPLVENAVYTGLSQVIGTPLYMSPEQAEYNSLDVDTRSDVYSLGVILYELITGSTPFDREVLKRVGFDEMRRIIREDEPARPSARVSTLNAEALSTIAGQRHIEPRKLSHQFRGELDWIVMKAIEKSRNRRYDSAISFAADVGRFLDDLPVEASPPSTFYRLRKFAKRHRAGLITSAALLCIMIAATALSTRYAFIADRALGDSERDRKAADAQRTIAEIRQKEADSLQQEAVAQRDATQQALYKADIRLAGIDHRDVNPLRLHKTLRTHIPPENAPDMRAWEWHYLLGASHQETSAILGHRSSVEDVDWSPDGKRIASTGFDGVRVCEASTGALIYENRDGLTLKLGGAWSPDSRHYAWGSAADENVIRIWDSVTSKITLLKGHTYSLRQVCWSPDGRRLLSVSLDRTCRIWDVDTQECLFVVQDDESLLEVCWNPMRECAAIARGKGVLIINPTTGEVVTKTSEGDYVISVAFSADGAKLIVGDNSGRCIIHDVDTWKVLLNFHAHDNGIHGIAANPKYPSFATCGADGVAHIWRLADGRKHSTLFGHDGAVNDVDWDPTGLRLVTGSSDQRVLTWNVLESPTFHRISLGNTKASAITWVADSSNISCTSEGGSMFSIDIATRKVVQTRDLHGQDKSDNQPKSADMEVYLESCARDRNNKDKQLFFDSNKERILWSGDESKVAVVTSKWKPMGASGSGYDIEIWNAGEKGRVFSTQVLAVEDAQWARDHRRLAVAGKGQESDGGTLGNAGWVYIFDAEAGDKFLKMRFGSTRESASAIGWNPSGTRIVGGNVTGLACIWDAVDGKLVKSLAIHQARIQSLAWSPDAKRIASADSRGQVKILDAETLEELLTLSEGAGGAKHLAWSPDGRQLAGIHSSGNVIIWNASRGFAYSNSDAFRKRNTAQKIDELLAEVEFHQKKNDLESALRVLDQLLQADTDHVGGLLMRGRIFYHLSRFNLAIADYKRVSELNPEHQIAWNWLGVSQTRLGQFDEAIASLTAAYDANPKTGNNGPTQNRAIAYILRGDVEKGKSDLKLISDKNPINNASELLAVLYVSRGEFELYSELCNRIANESVGSSEAGLNTMLRTFALGPNAVSDYAPLLESAEQMRNTSLTNLTVAENYGAILYRAGHFEEAMKQLVESSARVMGNGQVNCSWYLRAMTYKQLKQESNAIEWLKKADAAADALFSLGNQASWQHRFEIQIFQKEARELIHVNRP